MKARFKAIGVCVGIMVISFLSVVAYAGSGYAGKGGDYGEKGVDNLAKELELTPKQQKQFNKQCEIVHKQKKKNWQLLKGKKRELKEELEKINLDERKTKKIIKEYKKLKAEVINQRIDSGLKMKKILTAEQFDKFHQRVNIGKKEMMRRRKEKMHGKNTDNFVKELDLTPHQQEKMEKYHKSKRQKKEKMHKEMMYNLIRELDLTSQQQEQLGKCREANHGQQRKSRDLLRDKRKELETELAKYDSDEGKIRGIGAQLTDLWGEAIEQRTNSVLEIKKILTPEQFEKFQQKKNTFKHKKAGKRGHPVSKGQFPLE
ncbi:Spy/CpxP family protein refolding chaperone [bacterium]|nr:Spy/CpxP family protein refolding chaperone [bacterium]